MLVIDAKIGFYFVNFVITLIIITKSIINLFSFLNTLVKNHLKDLLKKSKPCKTNLSTQYHLLKLQNMVADLSKW